MTAVPARITRRIVTRRIAATTVAILVACASLHGQATERWASLSKDRSVLLTLKSDGTAEYEELLRHADGQLALLRSPDATWGPHTIPPGVTWPQLAGRGKASRYFWVKLRLPDGAATLDFAQVGNRVLQVDKTGIVLTLSKVDDHQRK